MSKKAKQNRKPSRVKSQEVKHAKAREPLNLSDMTETELKKHLSGMAAGPGRTFSEAQLDAMARRNQERIDRENAARLAADRPGRRTHGPDFRTVLWDHNEYTFTGSQAAVVKMLWNARVNGTPAIGDQTLIDAAGVADTISLKKLFKGNSAWGTLIIAGNRKGTHRLPS